MSGALVLRHSESWGFRAVDADRMVWRRLRRGFGGVTRLIPPYRAMWLLLLAIRRGSGVRYLNPEPDDKGFQHCPNPSVGALIGGASSV